jgi:hypothetical protein
MSPAPLRSEVRPKLSMESGWILLRVIRVQDLIGVCVPDVWLVTISFMVILKFVKFVNYLQTRALPSASLLLSNEAILQRS